MRRTPGILITVILTAGCSNGTPKPSGSTPTKPTAATTTATTTTHDVSADKQSASTIVLKAADAGSGFTGTAHDTTADDDLGPCVNQDPLLSGTDYPTQADGQDLTNNAGLPSTVIVSSVRIAPTVEAATAAMASIKAPGVLACLTDLYKTSITDSGITVSSFTLSPQTVAAVGDDIFAFKLLATATKPGTNPTHITMYILLVRKGRVLNKLTIIGENVVPPLSSATRLATTMTTRAAAVQ